MMGPTPRQKRARLWAGVYVAVFGADADTDESAVESREDSASADERSDHHHRREN